MKQVTIHEAKTHLSRLIREVEGGATIQVKRGNKIVARLIPESEPTQPRTWGQGAGKMNLGDDFDDPLPAEFMRHFQE